MLFMKILDYVRHTSRAVGAHGGCRADDNVFLQLAPNASCPQVQRSIPAPPGHFHQNGWRNQTHFVVACSSRPQNTSLDGGHGVAVSGQRWRRFWRPCDIHRWMTDPSMFQSCAQDNCFRSNFASCLAATDVHGCYNAG